MWLKGVSNAILCTEHKCKEASHTVAAEKATTVLGLYPDVKIVLKIVPFGGSKKFLSL